MRTKREKKSGQYHFLYTTILLIPLSASMPRPRLLEVTLLLQLLLKLVSLSSSWPLVPSSCLSSCSFPWHIARHAAYGTTILLIKILLIKILLPVAIFQSFQYKSEFLKMFGDFTNMNKKTCKKPCEKYWGRNGCSDTNYDLRISTVHGIHYAL